MLFWTMFRIHVVLYCLYCITMALTVGHFVQFEKLMNNNLMFTENIGLYKTPLARCVLMCLSIRHCVVCGYDLTGQCSLHAVNSTFIEKPGWSLYVKGSGMNVDLMPGATAWNCKTCFYGTADRALDGNTAPHFYKGGSCSCAHKICQPKAWWAMQFGRPGIVTSVDIYLRNDQVKRNSNRTVLVSQTRDDVINNIGTLCGGYYGPVIDTPPYMVRITCTQPIYGTFLRITYEVPREPLVLCEVIVYNI